MLPQTYEIIIYNNEKAVDDIIKKIKEMKDDE